mmetsp:Transcript_22726/g.70792  ORF Transcript_22726/g.70792 Transcript_22726/m.70792 type:complete len:185 (-) Transcript_22726:186-740(-)
MNAVLAHKQRMPNGELVARTAVLAAKARVAMHGYRERNLALRLMAWTAHESPEARRVEKERRLKAKGSVQPVRLSVFEPMLFALARLRPKADTRHRLQQTRVAAEVEVARQALEQSLPRERQGLRVAPAHAVAKRGHAALAARRLARKPVQPPAAAMGADEEACLQRWMRAHLRPRDPPPKKER